MTHRPTSFAFMRRAEPGIAASKGPRLGTWLRALFACLIACGLALGLTAPAMAQGLGAKKQKQTDLGTILAPPKVELDPADAASGRRDDLRQREQSRHGEGQCRDLLRQLHAARRPGDLRPQRQHPRCAGQRAHQGPRRRDHHLEPDDADRRLPRRVHRRVARGDQGRHAHRGADRLTRGGQRHGVPERLVHAVQTLRRQSRRGADVAHPRAEDHSPQGRGDDHLSQRFL